MPHKKHFLFTALGTVPAGLLMLACPDAAAEGVSRGLSLCADTLIPSLFPFMVLAMFVSCSGASVFFSRMLGPLCRRWLRLPESFGPVLLMSFIGGYPVGGRMLQNMLKHKEVSVSDASRFLCFSVSPAPSFAVVTVGVGLMGSLRAGFILYGCHLFTALLLGGWQARRSKAPQPESSSPPAPMPFSAALVAAVSSAIEGMLSICGFVLVFSVLLSLLRQTGVLPALSLGIAHLSGSRLSASFLSAAISGLLEVTCGIFACKELSWVGLCLLVPFLVSFGSFSVLCQISACLQGYAVPMGRLLWGRFIHACLSALMSAPLLYQMQPAVGAMTQAARPLVRTDSLFSTLALLGMCSLFLLSFGELRPSQKSGKF